MNTRVVVSFVFLILALAATAQPVTRFRVTQLYPPTDTTEQWFIQAGNYADTVKWVPVDSISGDGNGIISALPAGNVSINGGGNLLYIDNTSLIGLESDEVLLGIPYTDYIEIVSGNITLYTKSGTNASNLNMSPSALYFTRTKDATQENSIVMQDDSGIRFQGEESNVLYDYEFPYTNPSTTLNDTTIMAWRGTGSAASPVGFIDYSSAGTGSGWIKDSLSAGDVVIGAATNDLDIDNMDSLSLTANNGMSFNSPDVWLQTTGTTTFHASPFVNFDGTGYLNFEMGFIGLNTGNDSIKISIDDFNDRVFVTPNFRIDKYSAPRFPYFTDSFSSYTTTDEGRLVYNTTDNTFMFWDGSAWNNLAPSADVPAGWESGYAIAETNTPDLQNVGTTWEALEAQSNITATADWSFSTGTDLYTYSGGTEKYLVNFSACFTLSSAILKDFTFTVQENGSDTNAKAIQTTSGADADITYCLSGIDIVTANNTDTFGLGFKVSSNSHNVTIESSQVSFTKL